VLLKSGAAMNSLSVLKIKTVDPQAVDPKSHKQDESFEFFVFAVSKFVKFNFADFAFCDFLIRRMRPVVCYRDDTRRRVRNYRAVKSACHSPYKLATAPINMTT
jgi:hypothetical protein